MDIPSTHDFASMQESFDITVGYISNFAALFQNFSANVTRLLSLDSGWRENVQSLQ